jgi:phosphoribosylanthranilate isomerase
MKQNRVIPAKICGIRDEHVAEHALFLGAKALGFVLADSPRKVDVPTLARIIRSLPNTLIQGRWLVAVFRDINDVAISQLQQLQASNTITHVQCDWIDQPLVQIHAPDLTCIPVFRDTPALRIDLAQAMQDPPHMLLIEGSQSGMGIAPDWARIYRATATHPTLKWMLAGGLSPANIIPAIRATNPSMVDVSSGVESSPGIKDLQRITTFLENVHLAFEQRATS